MPTRNRADVAKSPRRTVATWGALKILGLICGLAWMLVFGTQPVAAQQPKPADAFAAYRLVDGWVRAWSVPTGGEGGPKAVGACVTIKHNGEVVGRGVAWSKTLVGPDAGEAGVVRAAAAAAITEAEPRLKVPNDAMRDDTIRALAEYMTISVELSGPLENAEPSTWEDAELSLRPGLDGIAVRIVPTAQGVAPGPVFSVFPSQMLLTNQLPHRALSRAVAEAIGEGGAAAALDEPAKIREKQAIKMYRFRVEHVVQPVAKAAAVGVYRGQRLLTANQSFSTGDLQNMADALERRLIHDAKGMLKERDEDLALAVMTLVALDELAGWRATRSRVTHRYDFITELALRSRQTLPPAEKTEGLARWQILASALNDHTDETSGTNWVQQRNAIWGEQAGSNPPPQGNEASRVQSSERSFAQYVLLWSELVRTSNAKPDFVKGMTGVQSDLWLQSRGSVISHLPWLGWTELELERQGSKHAVADSPKPTLIPFRQMRTQCWQHQISITSATDDTLDMIGGIVFTKGLGEGGGNPYPTWQCVRPLAFIATMLGDSRLTEPAERPGEIAKLMLALRFLRQLQVDEASVWMYPNPAAAMGGIRVSTWDNTISTDATALTLLCVVETLKSLDAIAAETAKANPPAAPPEPTLPATPVSRP